MYYRAFVWTGKHYHGLHEPLITQDLFRCVQAVLTEKGQRPTGQQKHAWAFQGLISCGHCGCAFVAEITKQRYVYYHCTGKKGKCPEKYVREEDIATQFGEALRAIEMDGEVFAWIVTALKASHHDAKRYHDERVAAFQKQYQKLQERLDRMYIDKLDRGISQDLFDRMSEPFRTEQRDLLRHIEIHQHANQSYLDEGVHLLELAQKAVMLYDKQDMREKRRLLNFVCSNLQWRDGKLIPTYHKPFDLLTSANIEHTKTNAAPPGGSGVRPVGSPGRTRTSDQLVNSQSLYRLSYRGKVKEVYLI